MLIPFVLIQYPLGVLADRKTGEKEFLIGAIALAGLSTAFIPWIDAPDILLWCGILFMTRLGIAAIEVLRDSYFYKRIDGGDLDIIAFFRTSGPFSNIVAAIFIGLWLLFLPLSSVFLLPAFILLLALIPAFLLEDNVSEREVS
jgi:MFS-type transporter involved in bile tolerance (Atg22 family)